MLDGGDGTDTASYETSSSGVIVALSDTAGVASALASGGDAAGDTLTDIENLTGSAKSDTLTGNSGNNVLTGLGGGDVLNGGDGTDTASYAGSAAVNVNLDTGAVSGGDAAGDTFSSIENLTGSSNDDTLTGDASRTGLTAVRAQMPWPGLAATIRISSIMPVTRYRKRAAAGQILFEAA